MRIKYQNLAEQPQRLDRLLQLAHLAERCDTTVEDTFLLANSLRDSPQMQRCVARLMQDPRSSELIRSRQLHSRRPPEELASFEPGTLGKIYYEVIKNEGLSYTYGPDPDYFNDLESDADYVNYRVFCTHDFYHIVSGFALDVFGEIGARSLLVAQCGYPPMALTDVVNLLTSWLANDIFPGEDNDLDGELSQVYLVEVMSLGICIIVAAAIH
jgi:ubiquinone biosynthesis protein Coq4